ncbi:predicted protein [Plenodomus lingam JN3]|uniref:Predicted protein n=1 Tax=Leptosphaeria maculans (strain JN3 / isolate v23.1.3 / race Av1-4-5-6-7-8) TaxID=985895 RepID=E5ABU6_LEPMJ|nr:predicted protein [Plenodomus lingam JN3]CBY01137.1 predicted protein [Plenodomus lingam JN3]
MGRHTPARSFEHPAHEKISRMLSRVNTPTPSSVNQKPHISGALKFVDGEADRAQALAAAEVWKQRFGEEAKWKNAVGRIQRFAKEDHLREHHVIERRQIPSAHEPWLTVRTETGLGEEPSDGIILDSFPSESPTLRVVGDLVTSVIKGKERLLEPNISLPVSPAPASPFSPGGFWESLTPTDSSGFATPITTVPRTAVSGSLAPPADRDAKTAYEKVKRDIEDIARDVCASRLSIHKLFEGPNQIRLKDSMVRTKDRVQAAEIVVELRQLTTLEDVLVSEIPAKLDVLADEEAAMVRLNCIPTAEILQQNVDQWLQIDEETLEFKTLLDVQRDLLLGELKTKRKSLLALSAPAYELVWATCIFTYRQAKLESCGDGSSTGSDEQFAYDYGNFMRMLGGNVRQPGSLMAQIPWTTQRRPRTHSASPSTGLSTPPSRAGGIQSVPCDGDGNRNRNRNRTHENETNGLTLTPTPNPPILLRRTNANSPSTTTSTRRPRRKLHISTSNLSNTTFASYEVSNTASVPNPPPSLSIPPSIPATNPFPQTRSTRRQEPSLGALEDWAETLRVMECAYESGTGDGRTGTEGTGTGTGDRGSGCLGRESRMRGQSSPLSSSSSRYSRDEAGVVVGVGVGGEETQGRVGDASAVGDIAHVESLQSENLGHGRARPDSHTRIHTPTPSQTTHSSSTHTHTNTNTHTRQNNSSPDSTPHPHPQTPNTSWAQDLAEMQGREAVRRAGGLE